MKCIIFSCLQPERQTLMWSATWPLEVREMAGMFLEKPVMMTVGSTELRANPDIRQLVSRDLNCNPFMPTVPTFAVRETYVSRHNRGTSGDPLNR